jgi:hypothetical protein
MGLMKNWNNGMMEQWNDGFEGFFDNLNIQ